MSYHAGNKVDGKHYWLTPPELMDKVIAITGTPADQIYDPCPYPRPDGFNGLLAEWGDVSYVNPPFQSSYELMPNKKGEMKSRRVGMTAWVRKSIAEAAKGKTVVMVFPLDKWITLLVEAGAELINMGNVKWRSTEDGSAGVGSASRPIVAFVLRGKV